MVPWLKGCSGKGSTAKDYKGKGSTAKGSKGEGFKSTSLQGTDLEDTVFKDKGDDKGTEIQVVPRGSVRDGLTSVKDVDKAAPASVQDDDKGKAAPAPVWQPHRPRGSVGVANRKKDYPSEPKDPPSRRQSPSWTPPAKRRRSPSSSDTSGEYPSDSEP